MGGAHGAVGRDQMPILSRVLAATDAAYLGVQMPSVMRGTAVYPVRATGTTAELKAPGAAEDAVAATFSSTVISPSRLQARYLWRVEDAALLEGLEDALRNDLRMALGDELDNEILTGNGTAPHFRGLFKALGDGSLIASGQATYAEAGGLAAAGVDGIYAMTEADVRLLVGATTYQFLATRAPANDDSQNALERLTRMGGMVRASSRVAALANKRQSFIRRAGAGVGAEAVAPVWEGIELVRDPYTGAARGEVALTAIMLTGFQTIRTAAFHHGIIQTQA